MTTASVEMWGTRIGAVTWDARAGFARFEYSPEFQRSGIELAPIHMPLGDREYSFRALRRTSFDGLPGMLADALPDRFGSAIIDAWLASRGRTADEFDPVERLCYVGKRGMGALEFSPVVGPAWDTAKRVDVVRLVELASAVLNDREGFTASLAEADDATSAVHDILRVGTSAGGARAKAVIAWNEATGEIRSGQADAAPGFAHWLLKFDGVTGNGDRDLTDPLGFGRIEYAYSLMAKAAGIEMSACHLLEEGGRAHFLTKRFDRTDDGGKLHLQSLGALGHFDYDLPGTASYEDAFRIMETLDLPRAQFDEQFRRLVFNVLARNQDDHVKNIAFLMDKSGVWRLSPAYDLTFAFNPLGRWTSHHQMTIAGKREDVTRDDLRACARSAWLKPGRADELVDEVVAAVERWAEFAGEAEVSEQATTRIGQLHRPL